MTIAALTNEQAARAFQNARPQLATAIERIARNGGTPEVIRRLMLWYTGSYLLADWAEQAARYFQEARDVS